MSIPEILKSRRSIRKYQNRPVSKEVMRQILEVASYAPSAHNAQPWRFIILAEPNQKNALADAMAQAWNAELESDNIPLTMRHSKVHRSIERFTAAPVLILACLSLENMDSYPDSIRQGSERDLAVQSLAAALQNLLLAAHVRGLGACWYCAPLFCKRAVQAVLQIPKEVEPQALITLGYPDEAPMTPLRKPLSEWVYRGKWGFTF